MIRIVGIGLILLLVAPVQGSVFAMISGNVNSKNIYHSPINNTTSFNGVATSKPQFRIQFVQFHADLLGRSQTSQAGINYRLPDQRFGAAISTGSNYFGAVLEYDYHRLGVSSIPGSGLKYSHVHELFGGLRYFPMKPTFMLGNAAVRLTLGAMYGFDMQPYWKGYYFGGFVITPVRAVSGITVCAVYTPRSTPLGAYSSGPFWALRLGAVFGPSASK